MRCVIETEAIHVEELSVIEEIIRQLINKYTTVECEEFADECSLYAHEMPLRLRKLFCEFRNQKSNAGYLLLKGFSLDNTKIGPTPGHWDVEWEAPQTLREEIFQCLISSCVGDLFGWRTQENGRFLRHIVPIEADKNEQLGGSSSVELLWHIEEAFHPQRADMMSIMCYRNFEKAGTNVCSLSSLEVPSQYREVLSQPRFFIQPDKSHTPENNQSQFWKLHGDQFEKIQAFLDKPTPVAVLYGHPGNERLLIDQAFMEAQPHDEEALEALKWFHRHLDEKKHLIEMEAGDLLLIDNRRTVHGRTPYKPNYGPHARWLRRVNITSDLTKSFEWKGKPYERTIF